MNFSTLKERAELEWESMEASKETLIHIGAGTCGYAAGAEKVLERIEETGQSLRHPCRILQVGYIGMCYKEPLIALRKSGKPFIYYGNLNPDSAEQILTETLKNGNTHFYYFFSIAFPS